MNSMHLERAAQWSTRKLGNSRRFAYIFWIRPLQGPTGQWRSIFRRGADDHHRSPGLWMFPTDDKLHFRVSTTGNWNEGIDSVRQLPLNRWTHVALLVGNDKIQLLINGRVDAVKVVPTSSVAQPSGPLTFAAAPFPPVLSNIAQFQYVNSEKDESFVRQAMFNTVNRVGFGPPERTLFREAMALDRTNTPTFDIPNSKEFGYTFWLLPTAPNGNWRNVFRRGSDDHHRSPGVWLFPSDNKLHVRASTNSNWNEGCDSRTPLPIDRASHVAVSLGRGALKVRINGELACTVAIPTVNIAEPNGRLVLSSAPYPPHNGKIAYLKYYDSWISRSDIDNDMRSTAGAIEPPGGTVFELTFVNAVTGGPLAAATVTATQGSVSRTATTDGRGVVRLQLPTGSWNARSTKAGVTDSTMTLQSTGSGMQIIRVPMSPPLANGQLRFIVTWGPSPRGSPLSRPRMADARQIWTPTLPFRVAVWCSTAVRRAMRTTVWPTWTVM